MRKSIFLLAMIVLCGGMAMAIGKEKMKGVNGINFGWKFDKCVEAIGDVPRKLTRDEGNGEKRFSYSPATWGGQEWNGSVLQFYNDKLYQVGFYKTSDREEPEFLDKIKSHLTDLYGSPSNLQDKPDNMLWRSKDGNLAVLQHSVEKTDTGAKQHAYYLIFVDNKQVVKKAKQVDSDLRKLINGN
ncbi:MAG: hypothetical protein NC127_07960 [Muribaculum sp.]|nr:hypothetical protein [Muribaculum sp.]